MFDEEDPQDISYFNKMNLDFSEWVWSEDDDVNAFINGLVTRCFKNTLEEGDYHPTLSIAVVDGRAAFEFRWAAFGEVVVYNDMPSVVWGTDDMSQEERITIAEALEKAARQLREYDAPED